MKKTNLNILVTCLFGLMFFSCDCFDCQDSSDFKVFPSPLTYEYTGGSQEVIVLSPMDWVLVSKPVWCTVNPVSGVFGRTVVTVTITEENTGATRKGDLVFSTSDGRRTTVVAIQKKKSIDAYKITIPATSVFSASGVWNVTDENDVKIAEICYEYINGFSETVTSTVVYGVDGATKKRMNPGYLTNNGATVNWSSTANSCTVSSSSAAITVMYYDVATATLGLIPLPNAVEATQTPVTFADAEERTYPVVKVGKQYWMRENLKVRKYKNNGVLTNITTDLALVQWEIIGVTAPAEAACCVYESQNANVLDAIAIADFDDYGVLYNWYAASGGILNNNGWNVPSKDQLVTLSTYATGTGLKDTGTDFWEYKAGSNVTGFAARGAGFRDDGASNSGFGGLTLFAVFWSADESSSSSSKAPEGSVNAFLNTFNITAESFKFEGNSVRLMRDEL